EQLASNVGKSQVMDDLYSVFSHHGGMPVLHSDLREFAFTATPEFVEMLVGEYLASYIAWSGQRRVKCVVTDPDNTLWPGIVGEDGFSWSYLGFGGRFEGIHQAFKILKRRGILLATCSKNDEEAVLEGWQRGLESTKKSDVLRVDDFVIHKINWQRKSE